MAAKRTLSERAMREDCEEAKSSGDEESDGECEEEGRGVEGGEWGCHIACNSVKSWVQ